MCVLVRMCVFVCVNVFVLLVLCLFERSIFSRAYDGVHISRCLFDFLCMCVLCTYVYHRVFIFIVGIQFWHICFTPHSLSLSLSFSFSVSLHLSPTNCPIYHSLPYPPVLIGRIVLNGKKEKGGKKEREG